MSVTQSLPLAPNHRARTMALGGIIALEVLIFFAPPKLWAAAALALFVLAVSLALLAVLRGRDEIVILPWILIFPLGYYFLAFPREHPLLTLDRVFIAALLASACFAEYRDRPPIPQTLRKSAAYWVVFLLIALLSIPGGKTPLTYLRLWLEAFLLPALLAWYVVRHFEVRRHLAALHVVTCLMAIYVAAIGAAEVILQRDLLPLPGGSVNVAGDYAGSSGDLTAQIVVRPNGPFSTVNSFAMVGLVSFFFLTFLKKTLADQMPGWQRILHVVALAACLAEALMPLFKSVVVSLVAALVVSTYLTHGRQRALRVGAILSLGCAVFLLRAALPSVFEERTDSETLYQRLAQEKQTLAVFLDHPIAGVGFANYQEALHSSRYSTYFGSVNALDSPHNNLGAILTETGVLGLVPFVASQVLLVSAFWKLRQSSSCDSQQAWESFLFLFLCYWINGMALTIVYFADSNLWYLLVLAILYKYAISSPRAPDLRPTAFASVSK